MFTEDVDGGGATLDPERGRSGEVCGGAEQGVTVSEFVENLWKCCGKFEGKFVDLVFAKPVCPQSTFSSSVRF